MPFDLDPQIIFVLILFGFLAAFIDSVVGGGGLISLPALLFIGLNPTAAVATNKLAGTFGSLTSTISFYRSGTIKLKEIGKFFPLTFIGALIGAWVVTLIDPAVLKPLMLFMLAAVLLYTLYKKDWGSISTVTKLTAGKLALFIFIIFTIGFYDGFLGPGTGSFLIFSFLLFGYDFLKAAGNAKLLNFGSNIAALLMFIYLGQVQFAYGFIMGLAQIAGAVVGSQFAIKKGGGFVRKLFILVTLLLLCKNTYDFLFSN